MASLLFITTILLNLKKEKGWGAMFCPYRSGTFFTVNSALAHDRHYTMAGE
jgi:hypothetical protein